MKVKNTLDVDLIYSTLKDKLLNFIHGRERYTDNWAATQYVKNNFPSSQYTGNGQFEDVLCWCEQHLGNDWIWNFETFYFKYERDRTAFLLRWS